MTQTIREQLQALVKDIRFTRNLSIMLDRRRILMELESILATPDPAVTVRKGWIAKDITGVFWYREKPEWGGHGSWYPSDPDSYVSEYIGDIITDPWPDKPDGGPECVIEVG